MKETEHSHGHPPARDLSPREIAALVPLVVFIFWIGLQPQFFLSSMQPTLEPLARQAALNLHHADHDVENLVGPPQLSPGGLTRAD